MKTQEKNYLFPFVVVTSLFFMWGLMTSLNNILIPHLKALFTLSYTKAMLVQFCFFFAYFVISVPAGNLVDSLGHKKGIVIGLTTAGLGCIGFYPASNYFSYPIFLFSLFVLASGITILQVAANPYLSVLGPPKGAAARLNLGQAFNSLGTTIGPFFGTQLILVASQGLFNRSDKLALVQIPYLMLASTLILLALIIFAVKLPQIETQEKSEATTESESKKFNLFDYPHLVKGSLGIFLYVGAEVAIGSFLVNFLSLDHIGGLAEMDAGKFVSLYWGGAMIGRFIGAALSKFIAPQKLLAFNAVTAALLVALAIFSKGNVALVAILAVGLFNSVMFPNIFTLSIKGTNEFTGKASGFLCMAIVGGAIVPLFQGFMADQIGIQMAHVVPFFCYLYIFYFGLKGHQLKNEVL